MSRAITVTYYCPHCGIEQDVQVSPIIPAKTYGPPENCSPEEGGDVDPSECSTCGKPVDVETCHEKAADHERPDPDEDRTIWGED